MEKRFCRKAEVVSLGGEYFGLGFDLPAGKELFSLVNAESVKVGTVTVGQSVEEMEKYVYKRLEGEDGGMIYYLGEGEVPEVEGVIEGGMVDRVRGKDLSFFGDYNLIVGWLDGDGEKIEVYPDEIK